MGAGAAIAGARPVIEILFIDFLLQAMDQVVNQAAKYRFMSGGQGSVPVVIRTQGGAGESLAGQHSQSLEAMFYHVPGLQVVMPSTPYDAKGLLKSAIRSDQPVVFIEHKLLYMTEGEVPDEEYLVPLGVADIKRVGHRCDGGDLLPHDAPLPRCRRTARGARASASRSSTCGRSHPLDWTTVLESVRRTHRLVVVHEAIKRGGIGGDIAATVAEEAFDSLAGPIVRVAGRNTTIPFNMGLQRAAIPSVDDIVAGIQAAVRGVAVEVD